MRAPSLFSALAVLSLTPAVISIPLSADSRVERRASDAERAAAVKDAFEFAWSGYLEYAFPHDELHPVSNTPGDSRNGWGASAVDALSTAIIMNNPKVVNKILEHISGIDYTKTATEVSLFETTIRYLGAMLSGYDLLQGTDIAENPDHVETLLAQSKKLADVMKFAFDTKSGIPYNGLDITAQKPIGEPTNGLATTGTLVLEWMRLSDLTNEPEYGELAAKAESHILNPKPKKFEPFPGLTGSNFDVNTGLLLNGKVSWNGGADSAYEYLIKMFAYDQNRFKLYKDRWILAAESTMKHLKSSPSSRKDLIYLASYEDGKLNLDSQHLTCFDGGNFILGGQILKRKDFLDFGLKLTEGCRNTYHSTATKIGPESFGWDTAKIPDSQKDFYNKNGFYINNGDYNLRPEVIESYYYAYRATGDSMYQDWVWEAFVALNKTTRTDSAFTAIKDVNAKDGGEKHDNQESFFFAEVMKYAYMTFAPDGDWQVARDGNNKYVYNTEAHPFRVKTASKK